MKSNDIFKSLMDKPTSLAEQFYRKIKVKKFLPGLDFNFWPEEWKKVSFKGYARFKEIILPKPNMSSVISFKTMLVNRQSKSQFSKTPMSIKKLSNLLYYSAGLKKNKEPWIGDRFYPSAGARYPLEVYLIVLNSILPAGVYHYYLQSHSLEEMFLFQRLNINKLFNQTWLSNPTCIVLITAVFKRMTVKYGDRGYNYTLIEAGHLGQNFCLVSQSLKLSSCTIGGFNEDRLNQLLDIDGFQESVIYSLVVG